jgi:hypothetical protein
MVDKGVKQSKTCRQASNSSFPLIVIHGLWNPQPQKSHRYLNFYTGKLFQHNNSAICSTVAPGTPYSESLLIIAHLRCIPTFPGDYITHGAYKNIHTCMYSGTYLNEGTYLYLNGSGTYDPLQFLKDMACCTPSLATIPSTSTDLDPWGVH